MRIKFERINSELQKQITRIISTEVKDPRLGTGIVGVTKVAVTPDLRFAKVYVSVYASDAAARDEAFACVKRSAGFIRSRLGECVKIRLIPELHFELDTTADYGRKIDSILAKLTIPPPENTSDDEK